MTLGWTEERAEMAKQLWADGKSASAIAAALGGGVSRNAVIGKLHRMSGDYRDGRKVRVPGAAPKTKRANPKNNNTLGFSGARKRVNPGNIARKKTSRQFDPGLHAKEAEAASLPAPISLNLTLVQLTDKSCKFAVTPHALPALEQRFCGCRNWHGLPYCEYHSRIAYQPVDTRRSAAA